MSTRLEKIVVYVDARPVRLDVDHQLGRRVPQRLNDCDVFRARSRAGGDDLLEVRRTEELVSDAFGQYFICAFLPILCDAVDERGKLVAHISGISFPDAGEEDADGLLVREQALHVFAFLGYTYGRIPCVVLVDDHLPAPRRDEVSGNDCIINVPDDKVSFLLGEIYPRILPSISAKRKRVRVAPIFDTVCLEHFMATFSLRGGNRDVGKQILAFAAPHIIRNLAGRIVDHRIARTFQPGQRLGIQVIHRRELTVEQEVLLHILHYILHLPFALRICRTAEDNSERTALDIVLKDLCHAVVTNVLIIQEHGILIVNEVLRNAPEEGKRLLVTGDGRFTRERLVLEPDELVSAVTQQDGDEVHSDAIPVAPAKFCLAEVHLSVFPRSGLGKCRILALILTYLWQVVLLPDLHHIVVDRLRRHFRKIGVTFFQPVVHLRRRCVRIQRQLANDEVLVGLEDMRPADNLVRVALELSLVHLQILPDRPEVYAQLLCNPSD